MVALHVRDSQRLKSYGRFKKTAEIKLKRMAVSCGCEGGDELSLVTA